MRKPRKKSSNYLDKQTFNAAVTEISEKIREAIRNHQEPPQISNYLAKSIMDIVQGVSRLKNFNLYEFKDDMIGDAYLDCLRAFKSFNPNAITRSGQMNAYGYFTQVAYFAFLRRIKYEKKLLHRKMSNIESTESSVLDTIHDSHLLDPIHVSLLQYHYDEQHSYFGDDGDGHENTSS